MNLFICCTDDNFDQECFTHAKAYRLLINDILGEARQWEKYQIDMFIEKFGHLEKEQLIVALVEYLRERLIDIVHERKIPIDCS